MRLLILFLNVSASVAIRIVSNSILMSSQPPRVTSGQRGNELEKHRELYYRNGVKNMYQSIAVYHWISLPLCEKVTIESGKNMTVGAAVLCPAVCNSDVTTRPACVAKVSYISWAKLLLLFIGKVQTNMATLRSSNWSKKKRRKKYFFCINIDRYNQMYKYW